MASRDTRVDDNTPAAQPPSAAPEQSQERQRDAINDPDTPVVVPDAILPVGIASDVEAVAPFAARLQVMSPVYARASPLIEEGLVRMLALLKNASQLKVLWFPIEQFAKRSFRAYERILALPDSELLRACMRPGHKHNLILRMILTDIEDFTSVTNDYLRLSLVQRSRQHETVCLELSRLLDSFGRIVEEVESTFGLSVHHRLADPKRMRQGQLPPHEDDTLARLGSYALFRIEEVVSRQDPTDSFPNIFLFHELFYFLRNIAGSLDCALRFRMSRGADEADPGRQEQHQGLDDLFVDIDILDATDIDQLAFADVAAVHHWRHSVILQLIIMVAILVKRGDITRSPNFQAHLCFLLANLATCEQWELATDAAEFLVITLRFAVSTKPTAKARVALCSGLALLASTLSNCGRGLQAAQAIEEAIQGLQSLRDPGTERISEVMAHLRLVQSQILNDLADKVGNANDSGRANSTEASQAADAAIEIFRALDGVDKTGMLRSWADGDPERMAARCALAQALVLRANIIAEPSITKGEMANANAGKVGRPDPSDREHTHDSQVGIAEAAWPLLEEAVGHLLALTALNGALYRPRLAYALFHATLLLQDVPDTERAVRVITEALRPFRACAQHFPGWLHAWIALAEVELCRPQSAGETNNPDA
ncbi:hypothetical protein OC835_006425 [Tilletia horrida]|nr:hypothetical protein OC835_006425 [Tilletia horrida]